MQIDWNSATLQQCNSATCNAPALFDIHLNCFLYLYFFFSLSNFNLNCLCCMQTMPSFIFIECQLPMDVAATVAALALLHCAIGSQLRALSFVTASIAMGALDAPSFRYNNCNNNNNEQ